jgi:WD40 repeat protein
MGWFLAVGAMLLVGACKPEDDVYATSDELRRKANAIIEALTFEGGSVVEGSLPKAGDWMTAAPRLESFYSPLKILPGRAFDIRLVVGREDASRVGSLVLELEYADRRLHVPIQVDAQNGTATLSGVLNQVPDVDPVRAWAVLTLVDTEGNPGNRVFMPFNLVESIDSIDADIRTIATHFNLVSALAFPRQGPGNIIVSGSFDRTIAVWDLLDGRSLIRLVGHTGSVLSVAVTNDTTQIVSGGQDNTVRLWDTQSGTLLTTNNDHTDFVQAVALSPDDRLLASGSWDHSIRVRNLAGGSLVRLLEPGDRVNDVEFSPDGTLFAAGLGRLLHPGGVRVWNAADWTELFAFEDLDREVTAVAFSPDGAQLAAAYGRGMIRLWSLGDDLEIHTIDSGAGDVIDGLAFSPAPANLLTCVTYNGYFTTFNAGTGEIAFAGRAERALTAVTFSPDGQFVAIGNNKGVTRILQLSDIGP